MRRNLFRYLLFVLFIPGLMLAGELLLDRAAQPDNARALVRPAFIPAAGAQAEGSGFPEDEAGISAYFDAGTTINLNDVRNLFRTIEDETSQYIIGSVPISGYDEWMDAHVFVHVDGWAVAYYRLEDPTAKMVDVIGYSGTGDLNTNLETALTVIANGAGLPLPSVSFYHFQFPNATHFTIVGELNNATGSDFQVELPATYAYFERSGGLRGNGSSPGGAFNINGSTIFGCVKVCSDFIEPSELPAGSLHTISMSWNTNNIVLVLVYRIP